MKTIYSTISFFPFFIFLLIIAAPAAAQNDIFDQGSSGIIDNRNDTYFSPQENVKNKIGEDVHLEQLNFMAKINGTPIATNAPFWINRVASATYNFQAKHQTTDGSDIDQNGGTVGLFMDSRIGLSVNPSIQYSYAESSAPFGASATTRSFTPALGAALEFLHIIENTPYSPNSEVTSLVLAGTVGYTDSSKDSLSSSQILTTTDTSTWTYNAALSLSTYLKHSVGESNQYGGLLLTIIPSYSYSDNRANLLPTGIMTRTSSGKFSLKTQLDYALTYAVKLSVFGTWDHDVNQIVPPGQNAIYQDWGEFGGQLTVKLGKSMSLKAGYSYEAFNSLYYSHKVLATLNYTF